MNREARASFWAILQLRERDNSLKILARALSILLRYSWKESSGYGPLYSFFFFFTHLTQLTRLSFSKPAEITKRLTVALSPIRNYFCEREKERTDTGLVTMPKGHSSLRRSSEFLN